MNALNTLQIGELEVLSLFDGKASVPATGAYRTVSSHSRISSMRRALEAASTSTTSIQSGWPVRRHESQVPHGSAVGAGNDWQLRQRARMRAVVVFPVPRGPEKR